MTDLAAPGLAGVGLAGGARAVGLDEGSPDPHGRQRVRRAAGLMREFNDAGVLAAADVHVAQRLGRLGAESDERVLLAAALAVRAVRHGSVCVALSEVQGATAVEGVEQAVVDALPWPSAPEWDAVVAASPLVASGPDGPVDRPLRLVEGLLYLDRYWRQERLIATTVDDAARREQPAVDADRLQAAVGRLFGGGTEEPGAGESGAGAVGAGEPGAPDLQRLAAVVAARRWMSVLAGGPGTGKTTTVAKLLAALADQPAPPRRVALAAPTGKAAARLTEAVAEVSGSLDAEDRDRLGPLTATTLHRLLGFRPGARGRFKHDRHHRLPYDVVVVDEASMVPLTMMARLCEALRPDCRLILVGDPDQLASVEAGAVLGDLVHRSTGVVPPESDADRVAAADLASLAPDEQAAVRESGVVRLSQVHRFTGGIKDLAEAVRSGSRGDVSDVLAQGLADVEHVDLDVAGSPDLPALRAETVALGGSLVEAARQGDAVRALDLLEEQRILCAHREGAYGVTRWSRQVERWLQEGVPGYGAEGRWYVGRPLLVTANDHALRLYNGDTGVVVDDDGVPRAAFRRDGEVVMLPVSRLGDVQTVHAMSVHRSQGSQFGTVTLVLPPAESPLLTRELLYTAVTRARHKVRVVGSAESLLAAVERPIARASGLRRTVGA